MVILLVIVVKSSAIIVKQHEHIIEECPTRPQINAFQVGINDSISSNSVSIGAAK